MESGLSKELDQIVLLTVLVERFMRRMDGIEARIGTIEKDPAATNGDSRQNHGFNYGFGTPRRDES